MYNKIDLEAQFRTSNPKMMILLNDIKRVKLLKENKVKEAFEVAKENYNYTKKGEEKKH